MQPAKTEFEVVIVGSGFAGLCTAVKLREAGIDDFVILEKDREAGGTWWANQYPGCAVDVPSHLYCFSFGPHPGWTRAFARQEELLAYTRSIVRHFDLARHIRVATAFEGADLIEDSGSWRIRTSTGLLTARCIVSATGSLNRAAIPALPGLDRFQGKVFHSSAWDHGYALDGKRVAVIGTGASAIQFVPEIVGRVAQLDLYQRTAPWILPRPDRAIGRGERWLLARVPGLRRLYRALVYVQHEARALPYVHAPGLLRAAQWLALRHLRRQVSDPALRRKLTPDYTLGCKRVLLMNSYYPALTRPNLALLTAPIARVTETGIVGADGQERAVDAIIFGTGFEVAHALHAAQVRGRGGKLLFADGLEAYKGCAVAGFPNYFLVTGPNTGLGHNSMIYMIESGVRYVVDAIKTIRARGLHSVEVKAQVQHDYNAALQRRMRGTVWSTGCRSWYLDASGRNRTLWPGFTFTYRRLTRRFDIDNYLVNAGA